MSSRRRRQRGFSLLEVVVAFAIAAMALGIISQIFGRSGRHLSLARDYAQAMMLADSLLAEYGNVQTVRAGSFSDTHDRFQWKVAIQPLSAADNLAGETTGPDRDAAQWPSLLRINVVVLWKRYGKSRSVNVESLRLGGNEDDVPPS